MVDRTQIAAGVLTNPAIWNPAGVPGQTDKAILGPYALEVPANYAWLVGGITDAGSDDSNRSHITWKPGSSLKLFGEWAHGAWNNSTVDGAVIWDLNGYPIKYDYFGGAPHNRISHINGSYTALFEVENSGAHTFVGAPDGTAMYADCDLEFFVCTGVDWCIGGSYFGGNSLRLKNCVFNGGFVTNDGVIHYASDISIEDCDFRGCTATRESQDGEPMVSRLRWGWPGDEPITGARSFKRCTFSAHNQTSTSLSLYVDKVDSFSPEYIYLDRIQLKAHNYPKTAWNNLFVRHVGNFGATNGAPSGGIPINFTVITGDNDNPKPFWNWDGVWNDCVWEQLPFVGTYDAGDYFNALDGRTVILNRPVIIDGLGSGVFNALTSPRGGTYKINNGTIVISEMHHPTNGLIRNEGSGTFYGATLEMWSSIYYVDSNPSGNPNIRVFNFETAGADQVTGFDFNSYCNVSPDPAFVYFNVVSTTMNIGDPGFGQNDWINPPPPNFVDVKRGIVKWGALYGKVGYEETIEFLINGVNGYNPATGKQDPALITGLTVDDVADYIRAGLAPRNAIYKNSGKLGVTRGAIEWVPSDNDSAPYLQNSSLTTYILRSISL